MTLLDIRAVFGILGALLFFLGIAGQVLAQSLNSETSPANYIYFGLDRDVTDQLLAEETQAVFLVLTKDAHLPIRQRL